MQQTQKAHVEVISEQEFCRDFCTNNSLELYTIPRSKVKIPGVKSRTTIWKWDRILKANIPDYLICPYTGRQLWEKGEDLNLHQLKCLKQVSQWMRSHPNPKYEKLRAFLKENKEKFSIQAYFEELPHV
jgi:hypothetical protein